MTVVYKYPLPRDAEPGMSFDLEVESGGRFLRCETQHDVPTTWWEVDPNAPRSPRRLVYYMTGQEFVPGVKRTYLGMFMLNDGTFIGHLYEIDPPTEPVLSIRIR